MGLVSTYFPPSFNTLTDQVSNLDYVVYINIDYAERKRRWNLRSTDDSVQIYIDPDFNLLFNEFFLQLSLHIPILFLSSAVDSPDHLAGQVIEFVGDRLNTNPVTFKGILDLNLS